MCKNRMAQVNFQTNEFQATLYFNVVAKEYEGMHNMKILVNDFEDFDYKMNSFYTGNYEDIFKEKLTIEEIEFEGVSFKGRQDTERFSIDMTDGWKRATVIFDEKKFGDVNIDKIKRIEKIIRE